MAITVDDIRTKQFKTEMRGYSKDEVDDFLDELADQTAELASENTAVKRDYEALQAEMAALDAELTELRLNKPAAASEPQTAQTPVSEINESGYLKNIEATMRETLISAQRIADETVSKAKAEAAAIVKEAQDKAAAREEESNQKLTAVQAAYDGIKAAYAKYRADYEALLEAQHSYLNENNLD